jgi:hypothetical protein
VVRYLVDEEAKIEEARLICVLVVQLCVLA